MFLVGVINGGGFIHLDYLFYVQVGLHCDSHFVNLPRVLYCVLIELYIRNYTPPRPHPSLSRRLHVGDDLIEGSATKRKPLSVSEAEKSSLRIGYLPSSSKDNYNWWGGADLPDWGPIQLTRQRPSRRLTDGGVAARISTLSVETGKSVLGTISVGPTHLDRGLYIDDLYISYDSYLEFDISEAPVAYIFTKYDYSSIVHRIGFWAPRYGGRRSAKVTYWGNGVYCIGIDKYREWTPPMVPEPTTYGVGLMGLGVAVACCHPRLRRRREALHAAR